MLIFRWKQGSVQLQEPDFDIAISGGGEEEAEVIAVVDTLARRKRFFCHARKCCCRWDKVRWPVRHVVWRRWSLPHRRQARPLLPSRSKFKLRTCLSVVGRAIRTLKRDRELPTLMVVVWRVKTAQKHSRLHILVTFIQPQLYGASLRGRSACHA